MRPRLIALVLGVVGLANCSVPDHSSEAGPIVLYNATVIDGTGSVPKPRQTVVIRGDSIAQIGEVGEVAVPPGATLVDLSGKWVLPGFIDLHVHFPPDTSVHDAILSRLLEFGITAILNPGARPGTGVALRERLRRGEVLGPQMYTAGRLIDDTPEGREIGGWAAQASTPESMRAEIRDQAERGVDFVKLYAGLGPALVSVAIEESHTHGIPVIGHLETTNWGDAARMGIDMLVHSGWATPMDEVISLPDPKNATDTDWYLAYAAAPGNEKFAALVSALVEEDVVVVPTLAVQQVSALGTDTTLLAQLRPELAPEADVPGWWGEGWHKQHPYYGYESEEEAQHELGLYQEAGIPPLKILGMATRNGAEALGILSFTGTIEVGKRADVLVLSADPSTDIGNTQEIERVFLAGREVVAR